MEADTPDVEQAIQEALEGESAAELRLKNPWYSVIAHPLTVNDAQCMIECLRLDILDTFTIDNYNIHDTALLNVFRIGLPLCTSITKVRLCKTHLGNEGLERLLPAFYMTSVTSLGLWENNIQGQHGGEVLCYLLAGTDTLLDLELDDNPIGQEGAGGLGKGLAENKNRLQKLSLMDCPIGNDGLANLVLSMGEANHDSLTDLELTAAGNVVSK